MNKQYLSTKEMYRVFQNEKILKILKNSIVAKNGCSIVIEINRENLNIVNGWLKRKDV